MTTSNTKVRTGSKEAPTEPFKRAVLGGLIRYNTEKMGKQKYRRFAVSLRDKKEIVGGIVGEVWTTVLFIQFFWIEERFRQGPRDGADRKNRGGGPALWSGAVLSRHDELPGSGLLPGMRI